MRRTGPIRSAGVVGAGTMGSGIAQKLAMEGVPVVLIDTAEALLGKALDRIRGLLQEGVARKALRPADADAVLSRLSLSTTLGPLAERELVIEAIYEEPAAKAKLFAQLGRACKPDAILATNTSSLSVTALAKAAEHPARVLGLHFFYHPVKNRLVELVRGEESSEEAAARLEEFCRKIGTVVLRVQDRPGFAVNRFFVPWLNEAARLAEEGQGTPASIDEAARAAFGVGLGPFALMNATGVPIALHAARSLERALSPFYAPAQALQRQGALQQGWDLTETAPAGDPSAIAARLWGAVLYAAFSMLEEGVASPEDIDRGAKVGLRWTQGPFEAARRFGAAKTKAWIAAATAPFKLQAPESIARVASRRSAWTPRLVDTARAGTLGRVILNRPETLNALGPALVGQLDAAMEGMAVDPAVRAISLEGAGKAFAAGADVKFFVDAIEGKRLQDIYRFTAQGQKALLAIERCPKPVIARLNGMALGGGAELALACRWRVATEKAVLRFPETGIGLYPGLGGTQRLPRLIGKALAKYFIFTGAPIGAALALELSLVDRLCAFEEMEEEMLRLAEANEPRRPPDGGHLSTCGKGFCRCLVAAPFSDDNVAALLAARAPGAGAEAPNPFLRKAFESLCAKAPVALALANRVMDEGYPLALEESLQVELRHLREVFETRDAYEGLRSIGGRPPVFEGR